MAPFFKGLLLIPWIIPRGEPLFNFQLKIVYPPQYECNIILGVRNAGRSSAKYVQLFLNTYPHKIDFIDGLDGNGNHGLPMLTSDNKLEGVTFTADANTVIHPNSHLEVTKIRFFIKDTDKKVKDATIAYKIYAESVKDVKNKKVIRGDEIIEKILPH